MFSNSAEHRQAQLVFKNFCIRASIVLTFLFRLLTQFKACFSANLFVINFHYSRAIVMQISRFLLLRVFKRAESPERDQQSERRRLQRTRTLRQSGKQIDRSASNIRRRRSSSSTDTTTTTSVFDKFLFFAQSNSMTQYNRTTVFVVS